MQTKRFERKWICIGPLANANLRPYNHTIGLYKHIVKGRVMYIGKATEINNGGFRKRLSDYRRDSNSARKHSSGQIIHEHLYEITTYLLPIDTIYETTILEKEFIRKYNPPWNVQYNR